MTAKEAKAKSAAAQKRREAAEEKAAQERQLEHDRLKRTLKKENLPYELEEVHNRINQAIKDGTDTSGVYYNCGCEDRGSIMQDLLAKALRAEGYMVEQRWYTPSNDEGYDTGPTSYSIYVKWLEGSDE